MSNKGGYEIGVTYLKASKVYLAVSDVMLVTWKDGKLKEIVPYSKYGTARDVSTIELCNRWGIGLETLDEATKVYFTPNVCRDSIPTGRRRYPSIITRLVTMTLKR